MAERSSSRAPVWIWFLLILLVLTLFYYFFKPRNPDEVPGPLPGIDVRNLEQNPEVPETVPVPPDAAPPWRESSGARQQMPAD